MFSVLSNKGSAALPRVACLVALCGLVGGCAVGPDYMVPELAVPAAFVAQGGGKPMPQAGVSEAVRTDLSEWWRTLRDPQLNALVARALNSNLSIEMALDRLQQARLQMVVIGSQALPEVNAGAGGGVGTGTDETKGRASQPLRSATNNAGLKSINEAGGLDAEWEIDLFGKIVRRVEAQAYTTEALQDARDWIYVTVAADVARLYIDLRARQAKLEILKRDIEAARSVLNLAQTRFDRGLTNELDVTLARRQVATLEAGLAPLTAQVSSSAYAIAVLLGEYPETIARELRRPRAVPALPARVPVGVPVDLLRRRPDIREAERLLAASVAIVGARTADLFPSLVITAAGGGQGGPRSGSAVPITWIGSVGPSIDAPILDFGRMDALIEIADYRARELAANYKQTILAAVQQVDDADATYRGYQQSLRSLDEALDAAHQATRVASERYDRGLTDFLNVLDAERQEFDLEQRRAEVKQLAGDSLVALYKALGGGWPRNQLIPPVRRPDPAAIAALKRLAPPPAPDGVVEVPR